MVEGVEGKPEPDLQLGTSHLFSFYQLVTSCVVEPSTSSVSTAINYDHTAATSLAEGGSLSSKEYLISVVGHSHKLP